MTAEIPKVRPNVITAETRNLLNDYRGFRHVVRNTYTFQTNPDRMKPLVDGMESAFNHIQTELHLFAAWLEES